MEQMSRVDLLVLDVVGVYHIGIYPFMGKEYEPHSFYIFWALLPDWKPLREHFISQQGRSRFHTLR
jgi:hypothetical protein